MDVGLDFWFLVLVVGMALVFDYINGFHDAANAIATVVATKVLSPRTAVIYGAFFNFVGALMGTEVAATVGKGLVEQASITMETLFCALIGAITWNLITWYKGLPSSSSHALIGSLVGATFFSAPAQAGNKLVEGWRNIHWDALMEKVVLPMVTSPVAGVVGGFLVMLALTWVVFRIHLSKINWVFGKLQLVSAGVMALSHGHNDAQKSMGIIALAMATYYPAQAFHVDLWIIVSCGVAIALGTLSGGWKIIRTMGSKMIKLQPIHGFAAETTAAGIIMAASHFGIPLSTTHVISTSIMGVGATRRLSAVKWGIVGTILWAWVLTLPVTFLLSGSLMWLYQLWAK